MSNRKNPSLWAPIGKVKAGSLFGALVIIVIAFLSQIDESMLDWAGEWQAPIGAALGVVIAMLAAYAKFDPDVLQRGLPTTEPADPVDTEDDDEDDDDGDGDEGDEEDGDPNDDEIAEDEDGAPNEITEDV